MNLKQLSQEGYTAYAESHGEPMPSWEELTDAERASWRIATFRILTLAQEDNEADQITQTA